MSFKAPINLRNDVRDALKGYFDQYLSKDMVLYDIGCGDKPFADVLNGKVAKHIGVDIEDGFYDASHIDLVGTAYDVPADDNSADAIVSSQVLEHLDQPLASFKEMQRLMKPGGLLFLSSPFLYPIHAVPHDYGRYTNYFLERELNNHGFEIVDQTQIGGFWYCMGMYAGMYLQLFDRGILRKLYITRIIIWLIKAFFALMHIFEGALIELFDKDPDAFRAIWTVNYVLVAKKVSS